MICLFTSISHLRDLTMDVIFQNIFSTVLLKHEFKRRFFSFSAWQHLNFHASCYFCSPCMAHIAGACPCGISLSLCRTHFQCDWDGTWSFFEEQHTVAGASRPPRSYSCCQPESSTGLLSFSVCREIIHENRTERNQVIGQDLSMASDTLQGWAGNLCVLHTA